MITKLQQLKDFMAAGNHRAALHLAASWGKRGLGSGPAADAITQAWAAMANPGFYKQLGKDPDALIRAGLDAIRTRYKIMEVQHAGDTQE